MAPASGCRNEGRRGLGSRPSLECLLADPGEPKSVSLLLGGWGTDGIPISKEEREHGVGFASAQKGGIKLKCQSGQTQRRGRDQGSIL